MVEFSHDKIIARRDYPGALDLLKQMDIPEDVKQSICEVGIRRGGLTMVSSVSDLILTLDATSVSPVVGSDEISLEQKIKEYSFSLYSLLKELIFVYALSEGSSALVASQLFGEIFKGKILLSYGMAYEFIDHGWNRITESGLKTYFCDKFPKVCGALEVAILDRIERGPKDFGASEAYDEDLWISALESLQKIHSKCHNHVYLDKVIQYTKDYLDSAIFEDTRDKKCVVRFKDGVFESENNVFRKGRPDDFCTMTMPLMFNSTSSVDSKELLISYLEKIFVDPTVLEFFLTYVASCLKPGNREKTLCIFRGCTNGGKTFICNLICSLFGKYATRIPITALSGRRTASGSATPDLAMLEDKLVAITQEPSEHERLNLGLVKELTGNESSIYMRKLYKDGKEVSVKCKMIISMNPVTIATDLDKASEARIRVIPFDSRFVDEESEVNPDKRIFAGDKDAGSRIPELLAPFIELIKDRYDSYAHGSIAVPQSIRKATANFFAENEPVVQFIATQHRSEIGVIHTAELWDLYRTWYADSFPGSRVCNIKKFCEVLRRQGLDVSGEGLSGYVKGITQAA